MIAKWKCIVLHHSLTKDSGTVSWQAIRRYHMGLISGSPYHMTDIGYHYGIELVNDEYEILAGRSLIREGAHTIGMNEKAIGVCFVGNFDETEVPARQWQKGLELVYTLASICFIPVNCIRGHRDYAPKSCPGKLFDLDKFRSDLLDVRI